MSRRKPALVLLVVAAIPLAAGCGKTKTVTTTVSPVILNTERVERSIETSARAQRNISARVSCPSGIVQKQGNTFKCTATTRRGTTTFTVTQTDSAGHVTYRSP